MNQPPRDRYFGGLTFKPELLNLNSRASICPDDSDEDI
jgi:hypothetical protein